MSGRSRADVPDGRDDLAALPSSGLAAASTLLTPRRATTGVFFVNGAVVGTWVAQIPWIQERFGLSKGEMGLVIAGMSLAVILALPFAGQAIVRYGSVRMTRVCGIAAALALNLVVLAPHPGLVVAALVVLGAAAGSMDVAMNSHGVAVETDLGRPIMSSLHAGWSFGGMIGAALAALFAAIALDARVAVGIASALLVLSLVTVARRIGHGAKAAGADTPRFTLPPRAVLLVATLCFLVMITEGAMADWGGLYLRTDLGADAALAALAFAFFTAGMTAGRVVGDRANDRMGPVALLRWGALLTGVPLVVMLVAGTPAVALAGLFAIGLGVANGVPLMFSAAGRRRDVPPGPSIAAVSSMGSLGFLAGPPFIGLLGDAVSLPWALSTLTLGAVAVFVLARRAVGGTAPRAESQPARAAA